MAKHTLLLTQSLAKPLHGSYRDGDRRVSLSYIMSRLALGPYRVILKRNFNTACWVPPAGSRDSHSIYYGDMMLNQAVDFFCNKEGIKVPEKEKLAKTAIATIQKQLRERRDRIPESIKPSSGAIFNEKMDWVNDHLNSDQSQALMELCTRAVHSYGRHEREHARNTSQDLDRVTKDLALLGIAFSWFNLFEDARIEARSRVEQGEPFGWLSFEKLVPADSPFSLFLRCIQLEGAPDTETLDSEDAFGLTGTFTLGAAAESVAGYYERACLAPTDQHLYPIMVEFLDEFKKEMPEPKERSKGKGEEGSPSGGAPGEGGEEGEDSGSDPAPDLTAAAEAAEKGDEFFDEFEKDAEVVGGTDEAGKEAEEKARKDGEGSPKGSKKASGHKGQIESVTPAESGGAATPRDFLSSREGVLDSTYQKRVDELTVRLLKIFEAKNIPVATEAPGRRMSSRHLARDELRFVRKQVVGGRNKRKYAILYDCSGSMSGQPDREGKVFLLALNNIAKRGYLKGKLILSGWTGGQPKWLSYELPVADSIILSIVPSHGHEGLNNTLSDHLKEIRSYDDVYVYTDAHITDAPMNKEQFERFGVLPVGLYVGSEDSAKHMARHFPRHIIRPTIEALVEKLLTRNRRTVG